MTKLKSFATLSMFLLVFISFPIIAGCSESSSVNQVEQTKSPVIGTAQTFRAITLATQSAEKIKATFSTYYADAIATEEALKNYYEEKKNWPLILHDTFDDNRNEWPLEDDDGDLASVTWEIEKGKYMWDAHAKQGFVYWSYPNLNTVSDFSLNVDAQQIEGPQTSEYGLVFRLLDENNYYLFMIDKEKNYRVQLYYEGKWVTISHGTISPAILHDDVNRITLVGEGPIFRFYINDIFIAEETDHTLTSGKYGIAIGLSNPQDHAVFEFDNFELRSQEEISKSE